MSVLKKELIVIEMILWSLWNSGFVLVMLDWIR